MTIARCRLTGTPRVGARLQPRTLLRGELADEHLRRTHHHLLAREHTAPFAPPSPQQAVSGLRGYLDPRGAGSFRFPGSANDAAAPETTKARIPRHDAEPEPMELVGLEPTASWVRSRRASRLTSAI